MSHSRLGCGPQMNQDKADRVSVLQDRSQKNSVHGFASALGSVAAMVSPAAGKSFRMERDTGSKMLATSMMQNPVVRSAWLILREKFGETMGSDAIDREFRSESRQQSTSRVSSSREAFLLSLFSRNHVHV